MENIIFRLMLNGNLVGYEWHKKENVIIGIYHSNDQENWNLTIAHRGLNYILHDRKDMFTNQSDIKGVNIYENDEIERFRESPNRSRGHVVWDKDGCGFIYKPLSYDYTMGARTRKLSKNNIKLESMEVTGIGKPL